MKNLLLFPVLALCAIMMATCQKKDAPAGFSMEKTFENDTLTVYKTNNGYTVSDTIIKDTDDKDNDYQHNVFITDEQGRPFAVVAYDNDAYLDLYKYLYDEKSNVKGIVTFEDEYLCFYKAQNKYSYDDVVGEDVLNSQFDTEDENFRIEKILYDLIFKKSENEPYFTRYYFIRDSLDRIVKVYDPVKYRSIPAPYGYHIDCQIEEAELIITLISNNKDEDDDYDGYEFYEYPNAYLEIQ